MTDVGIAPAPSAPSAPAPAPAETPINPNPVTPPQPIGSQAPPAAVGDLKGSEHHPQSRREATREAVRKAFERSSEPPKAAGSRMGHNQPPEPMAKEKSEPPKQAPLDLKKRPDDQARPRAEHGHFAAKTGDSSVAAAGSPSQRQTQAGTARQPQGQPAPYNVVQLPKDARFREPPRRWNKQAKAEWGAAPESVRASVRHMQKQFANTYQRMKADTEVMNTIRPYQQLAQQHGTTLARALGNYVPMEEKLRTDPIGGLDVIVNNLNLRTPDGQKLGLRDIAWHVLNLTPEAHKTTQLQNSQTAVAQQMAQMRQQQEAIARNLQQLHYERRFSQTRQGVDRFAETHPRLDELGDLIEKELRLGFNLPTAYRRAELLRPATSASPATTRGAPAQTRTTDRSIHGAPDGAANGRTRDRPIGRRDAIASAFQRARGSL
jgi:hypothetical protein